MINDEVWLKELHTFLDEIKSPIPPLYVVKRAERKHCILFPESNYTDYLKRKHNESRRQWKARLKAIEYCNTVERK